MGAQARVFAGRASEATALLFTAATTATSTATTVTASAATVTAARTFFTRLVTVLVVVPLDTATTTGTTAFTAAISPVVLALLTSHLHLEGQAVFLLLNVALDVLLLIQDLLLLLVLAGRLVIGHLLLDLFNLFFELGGNLGRGDTDCRAFLNERDVMVEGLLVLVVFVFDVVCLLDYFLGAVLLLFALAADADHLVLLALFLGQAYFDFLERLQLLLLLADGFLGLLFLEFAGDDIGVTDEA